MRKICIGLLLFFLAGSRASEPEELCRAFNEFNGYSGMSKEGTWVSMCFKQRQFRLIIAEQNRLTLNETFEKERIRLETNFGVEGTIIKRIIVFRSGKFHTLEIARSVVSDAKGTYDSLIITDRDSNLILHEILIPVRGNLDHVYDLIEGSDRYRH